jgi:eukaryotic-like serine/threonine-protein kinase
MGLKMFPRFSKAAPVLGISLILTLIASACLNQPAAVQPIETTPVNLPTLSTMGGLNPPAANPSPTSPERATPTFTTTPETLQAPATIGPTYTPTPTETPGLGIGSTRISEMDRMEQVYVPAGEFLMGSVDPEAKTIEEGGRAYPEIPQHIVYLDSYWIDKYEVTNAQYALCVEAGVCEPPFAFSNYTYPKYYDNPEFGDYPVVWVSWYQAREYCEWAGRRLPTEAEWEKAARGTDGQKYPWGEEPVDGTRANFCDVNCTRTHAYLAMDDGYPDTAPVGSYPAGVSPYGAMDMSGNVWEWTSTLIYPYPYDPDDGREDPDSTWERVWRGGPWSNGIWWMRSSVRYRSVSEYKWYVLGIRCAASEGSLQQAP